MEIPQSAFSQILSLITFDNSLKEKQSGRSLTFGIINRRNQTCEYSRNNWLRGELYSALLQFAEQYVSIPWDTVSLSFGDRQQFHRLKNSRGNSFTVATGDFTGGGLTVSGESETYSINHKGLSYDLSKHSFKLEDYTGDRIVLFFYKFHSKKQQQLPKWDLRQEKGEWVFYRGETKMGRGGKKRKLTKYEGHLSITRGDILVSWE